MAKITKTGKTQFGLIENATGEYVQDVHPKRKRRIDLNAKKEKCQEIFMIRFLMNNRLESLVFRFMDFQNQLYLSVENIKQIASIIGKTDRFVYDYIKFLIADDVMIRVGKGLYFVNPEYAIKGAIFNRQAKMKADYYKIKSELANKPVKPKKVKILKFKEVAQ